MSGSAPQTKSEILRMLRPAGFRPSRRRGQSFLIDGNLMRRVVGAAELTPDDLVFEVGTGTASLTRLLADAAGKVITVEVDSLLAGVAADVLRDVPNVTLIHADVLSGKNRLNPEVVERLKGASAGSTRTKLVANLPYSVATPLVVNLVFGEVEFERMVFTVQRDVAERLTAKPGTREYGWVSVVAAISGEVKILTHMPPAVFWPRPRVESSLVVFRPRKDWQKDKNIDGFRALGPFVFQHRRKTALRILRDYVERRDSERDPALFLGEASIEPKTRGDQLTPREILRLGDVVN